MLQRFCALLVLSAALLALAPTATADYSNCGSDGGPVCIYDEGTGCDGHTYVWVTGDGTLVGGAFAGGWKRCPSDPPYDYSYETIHVGIGSSLYSPYVILHYLEGGEGPTICRVEIATGTVVPHVYVDLPPVVCREVAPHPIPFGDLLPTV